MNQVEEDEEEELAKSPSNQTWKEAKKSEVSHITRPKGDDASRIRYPLLTAGYSHEDALTEFNANPSKVPPISAAIILNAERYNSYQVRRTYLALATNSAEEAEVISSIQLETNNT